MQFRTVILTLLLLPAGFVCAQDLPITADLRFENFNEENNFTNSFIGNLTVDRKGYTWAAGNGLLRFDGVSLKQFTNFNNQYHGLRHNYTDDLVTDRWGRLWIGNGLGLCYYNDTIGKFIYINKDANTPITYAYSFLIYGDDLWFVCNLGLSRVNLPTGVVSQTTLKEFPSPIELFPLADSILGVSSRTALYLYDMKKNTWKQKVFTDEGTIIRVRHCLPKHGNFWAGTNKGLWLLDKNGENMSPVKNTSHLNISDIAVHPLDPEKKYLWIATSNSGLQLFNTDTKKIEHEFFYDEDNPHSLASNNITSLHVDSMQRLWIGTEKGISLFDHRNQFWKTRQVTFRNEKTSNNEINKIIQDSADKNKVWMSCINQGILLVDWESKKIISHYKKFPAEFSLSFTEMFQLPGGKWLLLSKDKLIEWSPSNGRTIIVGNFPVPSSSPVGLELTSIIRAGPDVFYITANTGLYHYQPSSQTIKPRLLREGTAVLSLYDIVHGVYDKGMLWMGTRKGLLKYDTRDGKIRLYNHKGKDSASGNFLSQVTLTSNGQVLCAGTTGISIFNPADETILLVNEFGTIRNPTCYAIYTKDSLVWINSNAGLLQINLYSKKGAVIIVPQRISAYSPAPFGRVNEELVIGYRNRYTYFNPVQTTTPLLPSGPIIENIFLNNQPFYSTAGSYTENRLSHKENTLSFHFTAFEFNNPRKIRFRYKLEGHDEDWTYLDEQRNATYVRLPPGRYTFILQAGNSQGHWNEQSAVFNMYIIPPFWQRWWFWPLLGLLFVTVVVMTARRRVTLIRKREEEKTAVNKSIAGLETQLLRSQMNPHFIFNSLNSIQKYIWENKEEDAAEYLAKFAKLMRGILENSRKETVTLEEELAMMKLYIELEHRRSNGRFEYSIKTDPAISTSHILIPPMLLQPFIENAIWHGLNKKAETGQLLVRIIAKNDHLECVIDDDGVGRTTASTPMGSDDKQSLGIEITRQRVELLHRDSAQRAEIRIIDKEKNGRPAGTTVTVIIPLQYRTGHAT